MTDPTTAAGWWLIQHIAADDAGRYVAKVEAEAAKPYRDALERLVDAIPGTAVNLASSEPFDLARAVIQARALLRREVGE